MVFDVVICTAWKKSCNQGPLVAIHIVLFENNLLLFGVNWVPLNVRVYVVVVPNGRVILIIAVPFPTLLSRTALDAVPPAQLLRYGSPLRLSDFLDERGHCLVLLKGYEDLSTDGVHAFRLVSFSSLGMAEGLMRLLGVASS